MDFKYDVHNFVQTIRTQILDSIQILEDDIRFTQSNGDAPSCHPIDLHITPTTLKINKMVKRKVVESIHYSVNLEHERAEKTTTMTIFDCDSMGHPIVDSTWNRDPTIRFTTVPFMYVSPRDFKLNA